MQISGSCCPFLHAAVAEGMMKLNVFARKTLFLHLDVSRRGAINRLATPPGRFRWHLHSCSNAASASAGGGHHMYVPIRPVPTYHPLGVSQEVSPVPNHESTRSINSVCRLTAVGTKGMNVSMSAPTMTPFSISPRDKPSVPWLIIRVPAI
jgi:hypothetical protein